MGNPQFRPERILICRTDNIGDVVLTLPLAGFLKQRCPGVQVDFLVRAYAAGVVHHCRFVDQVLAIEHREDLQRMFSEGHYDTVIFAYPQHSVAVAAWRSRQWRTCLRLHASHRRGRGGANRAALAHG